MTKLDITTKYFLQTVTLIFITYSFMGSAYAQNATPPVPVQPSVAVPAQTAPNPNFQYLPQKAYVQSFGPEIGIPNSPTPALPSVTTVPVAPAQVQQNTVGGMDIGEIVSMVIAGASGFAAKLGFDKAKKAENTGKENSAMNVKQAIIQEEGLKLQYENMPDKGAGITDKPEIRLTEVAKMKDTAVDTATKS